MSTAEKPTKETLDQWHNDPSNWKWGIFYYNRKDKRIFPPKKFKAMGWTINFANPWSVLFFLVLIILIGAVSKYAY
jgi:uncharacterized membrane protein